VKKYLRRKQGIEKRKKFRIDAKYSK